MLASPTSPLRFADLQILKKGEEISRYLTYKRHAERRESISSLSFFLCPYYFSSQLVITKNKDQDRPRSDLAPSAQWWISSGQLALLRCCPNYRRSANCRL